MRTRLLITGACAVAVALALGAALTARAAPAKPKAPTGLHVLTGTPPAPPSALDHAQVDNDMKQLQLDQAQMQILTYQFEQTKTALAAKLKALERDGWDLDLQTWQYVPKGSAPPAATK